MPTSSLPLTSAGVGAGSSTDVKHCFRSHNQQWVVVADDAGLVRLNNYPAVLQHTPGYAHKGHASHIERVCFLADDTRVVSCGGHDQATYQWKVRGPGKPKPEDKVKAVQGMMTGLKAFAIELKAFAFSVKSWKLVKASSPQGARAREKHKELEHSAVEKCSNPLRAQK